MAGISTEGASAMAARSRVLRPRLRTLLGGVDVNKIEIPPPPSLAALYPKNVVVQRNNFATHDRFKAVFALCQAQDYEFWAQYNGLSFSLELMYEGITPFIMVFSGIVDSLEVDVFRGEVTLSGRNFGSYAVNRQAINNTYNNTAIKDIVTKVAATYGMNVDFGNVAPEGDFGVKVHDNYTHQALGAQTGDVTDWDILARIAFQTGRTLYEKQGVIYFHSKDDFNTYTVLAPTRTYSADGKVCHLGPSNSTALKLTHDFTQSKYVQTVVVNHNFHGPEVTLKKYPENVPAAAAHAPSYVPIANKDNDQAKEMAKSLNQNQMNAEWALDWTTSGPELLDVDVVDLIELVGTNSAFDGPFQIASIEHNIHWERGLSTTIIARWGKGSPDPGGIG